MQPHAMSSDRLPYVSLPTGAASAKKSIKHNLQYLQGFEEIILFFDNDEPGRKAAADAASVLPPGKVKIARLEAYKDAFRRITEQTIVKRYAEAVFQVEEYRPDGIVDAKTLLPLVTTPYPPNDFEYGIKGLNTLFHGIKIWRACCSVLQALEQASPHWCGVLQLHYYKMANQSVTWLLKNQIDGLYSD